MAEKLAGVSQRSRQQWLAQAEQHRIGQAAHVAKMQYDLIGENNHRKLQGLSIAYGKDMGQRIANGGTIDELAGAFDLYSADLDRTGKEGNRTPVQIETAKRGLSESVGQYATDHISASIEAGNIDGARNGYALLLKTERINPADYRKAVDELPRTIAFTKATKNIYTGQSATIRDTIGELNAMGKMPIEQMQKRDAIVRLGEQQLAENGRKAIQSIAEQQLQFEANPQKAVDRHAAGQRMLAAIDASPDLEPTQKQSEKASIAKWAQSSKAGTDSEIEALDIIDTVSVRTSQEDYSKLASRLLSLDLGASRPEYYAKLQAARKSTEATNTKDIITMAVGNQRGLTNEQQVDLRQFVAAKVQQDGIADPKEIAKLTAYRAATMPRELTVTQTRQKARIDAYDVQLGYINEALAEADKGTKKPSVKMVKIFADGTIGLEPVWETKTKAELLAMKQEAERTKTTLQGEFDKWKEPEAASQPATKRTPKDGDTAGNGKYVYSAAKGGWMVKP
jgi:hypothetical protein